MKVLFVGSPPAPRAGGAHSFLTTVRTALEQVTATGHTLDFGEKLLPGYDFTWFLTPDGKFTECETPFAFSVWDLGHRTIPFFPEVSLSGWKFDSREVRYREALPRAALVVASSKSVAAQCSSFYGIPAERIIVLREPADPYFSSEDHGDAAVVVQNHLLFTRYLLYPAQFWPHKNHITALKTLQHLPDDFRLVFTGADKGNRQHVFNRAREMFPKDRVVFTDFVTTPQLKNLYLNAYAALICTLMPARSLPVFEAQACGCPVVRADWNNQKNAQGSILFPPLDHRRAAEAIGWLSDDRYRTELIQRGRSITRLFSAANYAKGVVEALDQFADMRALWGVGYKHL